MGAKGELALSTHIVNERQVGRIADMARTALKNQGTKIGILGLTYKPDTQVTEASQSLELAGTLSEMGFDVHVPLPDCVTAERSPEACVRNTDLCIIATPWQEVSQIDESVFAGKMVVDCWRLLGKRGVELAKRYVAIGKGPG
jgi:UDPglucose 6-dehydrogenase